MTILHILQHALGRNEYGRNPNGGPDYRNYYCTGEGGESFLLCREAVSNGLMNEHAPSQISGGDNIFTVTDATGCSGTTSATSAVFPLETG